MSEINIDYFNNIVYKGVSNRLKEIFIKNNFLGFYIFIIDNYKEYPKFIEKLYVFSNGNKYCYCGNKTRFIDFKKGYLEYCSISCSKNSEKTKEKYRKTCMSRYGVDNVSKVDSIKKIKEDTFISRYGVKTFLQSKEVKEIVTDKYGVDNVFKSDLIKEKIRKKISEKYGVEHFTKTDNYKLKTKKTCLSKYGVDHFSKTQKWKELMEFSNLNIYLSRLKMSDDYNFISKNGNLNKILHLKCGNEFSIQTQLIRLRCDKSEEICTFCNKINHYKENELLKYLKSIYKGDIIKNYRDKLEIDFYLPELAIGFEFNGLYWHSELYKDSDYHILKTKHFRERNITIVNIWEDDWLYKRKIVESIIKSKLGIFDTKINARDCLFVEISDSECKKFLNENHIQGWCVSKYRYGLIFNGVLTSIITLGKERLNLGKKNNNIENLELIRYATKINTKVVGGFSKIIKNITKIINIKKILTYSDISMFNGDVYLKNGFKFLHESKPGYSYIINGIRKNRFSFNKSKLLKLGYTSSKSEKEIMFENNFYRIYDCGNSKFELNI